jgi:hypothetical protein
MISEKFRKFIHPIKNSNLELNDFVDGSHHKIWWIWECGHDFEKSIRDFCLKGKRCPFCSKKSKAFSGFNDLNTRQPELVKEWHPTKNGILIPEMFTEGSSKKIWWLCKKDSSHEWPAVIYTRIKEDLKRNKKGKSGCPYCSGRLPTKENNLAVKFPDKLSLWHRTKNLPLTPYDFSPQSAKKIWLECQCGHEWKAVVHGLKRDVGCPKCWLSKSKRTCQSKYGVSNASQSPLFSQKQAKSANDSKIIFHWKINTEMICRGSYEIGVINYLNKNKINFIWQVKIDIPLGILKIGGLVYFIDLYLPDEDKYIEVKGWLDRNQITKAKWLWFHETHPNSELWDKKKLKSLGIKVR